MGKNRRKPPSARGRARAVKHNSTVIYELHGSSVNPASFSDLYGAGLIELKRKIENGITRLTARLRYRGHTFWLEVETGIAHVRAVLHEPILPNGAAQALRSRLGDMIRNWATAEA